MEQISELLVSAAKLVGAIGVLGGVIFAIYRWYQKQEKQDEDIKEIKEVEIRKLKKENTLICYGLSACLDGLQQLGANHTVPVAKDKLDKYLNQAAHDEIEINVRGNHHV